MFLARLNAGRAIVRNGALPTSPILPIFLHRQQGGTRARQSSDLFPCDAQDFKAGLDKEKARRTASIMRRLNRPRRKGKHIRPSERLTIRRRNRSLTARKRGKSVEKASYEKGPLETLKENAASLHEKGWNDEMNARFLRDNVGTKI